MFAPTSQRPVHARLRRIGEEPRAHIHHAIDAGELPVTHFTRRSGSPHTLVLEKTTKLFEREAKGRAARVEALARLARSKRAFGGSAGGEVKPAKGGDADGSQRSATARKGVARAARRGS